MPPALTAGRRRSARHPRRPLARGLRRPPGARAARPRAHPACPARAAVPSTPAASRRRPRSRGSAPAPRAGRGTSKVAARSARRHRPGAARPALPPGPAPDRPLRASARSSIRDTARAGRACRNAGGTRAAPGCRSAAGRARPDRPAPRLRPGAPAPRRDSRPDRAHGCGSPRPAPASLRPARAASTRERTSAARRTRRSAGPPPTLRRRSGPARPGARRCGRESVRMSPGRRLQSGRTAP